jgi:hypothetical protein
MPTRTSLTCCESFAYSQSTSASKGDKFGCISYGFVSNMESALVAVAVIVQRSKVPTFLARCSLPTTPSGNLASDCGPRPGTAPANLIAVSP